jgi:hypothetical protein
MRFLAVPLAFALSVLGFAHAVKVSQTASRSEPVQRDAAREVATSVADGFTLASVGDLIIARPISHHHDDAFTAVASVLRNADVTFGNFEGSAFDIRQFTGHPQAEFGGAWVIGVPEVAGDLRSLGFDFVSRANNHATDWGVEGMRLT